MTDNGMENTSCTDMELITRLTAGEGEAFAPLLKRYTPLVENLTASTCEKSGEDIEEIRSEAVFALYRAAMTYNTEQADVTFGLYAKVCISHRLISCFVRRSGKIRTLSLDELVQNGDAGNIVSTEGYPDADFAEKEALERLYEKIHRVLSPYEVEVFNLWVEGYAAKQIAKTVGRDEKSVQNAIARGLAKIRSALQ